MKRSLLIILIAFSIGLSTSIQAQNKVKTWTVQVGAGYTVTERLGDAFASGFYVGKRLFNVLELGVSVNASLTQDPYYSFSYADAMPNSSYYFIQATQVEGEEWTQVEFGSAFSFTGVVGFSPTRLIWKNTRHDLVLGAQIGSAYKQHHWVYRNVPDSHIVVSTFANTSFSYGPRLAYEYKISDTLGVGVTASYDLSSIELFTTLATFNVHF
ncbi:hypothetical protein [Porphyromonas loveana]|uniref:hypothetical protein n=1 Tax=Porphyromonas loveana TaxID=1884669 RepID=UPI00359F91EB